MINTSFYTHTGICTFLMIMLYFNGSFSYVATGLIATSSVCHRHRTLMHDHCVRSWDAETGASWQRISCHICCIYIAVPHEPPPCVSWYLICGQTLQDTGCTVLSSGIDGLWCSAYMRLCICKNMKHLINNCNHISYN